jgi:hypothetical protein
MEECAGENRDEVSVSKLIVGVNCVWPDALSGITAVLATTSRWVFSHGTGYNLPQVAHL